MRNIKTVIQNNNFIESRDVRKQNSFTSIVIPLCTEFSISSTLVLCTQFCKQRESFVIVWCFDSPGAFKRQSLLTTTTRTDNLLCVCFAFEHVYSEFSGL